MKGPARVPCGPGCFECLGSDAVHPRTARARERRATAADIDEQLRDRDDDGPRT